MQPPKPHRTRDERIPSSPPALLTTGTSIHPATNCGARRRPSETLIVTVEYVMADIVSKKKRSWLMSRVRGANTLPEKRVEGVLREHKIKFRRQVRSLPGTPDLVIREMRVIVLVNGCFWHGHKNCTLSRLPRTRRKFWSEKFEANRRRDARVRRALRKMGWKVVTVWGCQTKDSVRMNRILDRALSLDVDGRPR